MTVKARFTTQMAAKHVLERTEKLTKVKEIKEIWVRGDMNEKERNKVRVGNWPK